MNLRSISLLGLLLALTAQSFAAGRVDCNTPQGTYQFVMSASSGDTDAAGFVREFSLIFYSKSNQGILKIGDFNFASESSNPLRAVYSGASNQKLIILGSFQGPQQGGSIEHGSPRSFQIMTSGGGSHEIVCD